jgi:hypothetical protein
MRFCLGILLLASSLLAQTGDVSRGREGNFERGSEGQPNMPRFHGDLESGVVVNPLFGGGRK